jgi:hypothetical protein
LDETPSSIEDDAGTTIPEVATSEDATARDREGAIIPLDASTVDAETASKFTLSIDEAGIGTTTVDGGKLG